MSQLYVQSIKTGFLSVRRMSGLLEAILTCVYVGQLLTADLFSTGLILSEQSWTTSSVIAQGRVSVHDSHAFLVV